ncbi:MAG: HpcH/HpaI aldolase/citrate lyase family protein [Thermomicrobiales bacterium]
MNTSNTALQKMLSGEAAFGWALGLGSALAAERMAQTGIDFIMIDGQHGSWGGDSTIAAFMAIKAGGATPMARVASNDYTRIGKLLDEGALGIIVPMVHTADDAKRAADACRFPPTGTRSWGWGRAGAYGDDYPHAVNTEIFVAVQIESAEAVKNAHAILGTDGVDGCWIGPSDLQLSLGYRPWSDDGVKALDEAVAKIEEAGKATGKILGFATNGPDHARSLAERGFRFLTAGSDIGFMLGGASAGLKILKG